MAGPGPRSIVLGPLAAPPRISLLTSALIGDEPDERWGNGASFEPESCGTDVARASLCPPSPITLGAGERPDAVSLDSFLIVAADTCSSFGFRSRDFQARVRRKLEACEPKQAEAELWTGSETGNAHLASLAADDVSVSPPMDPVEALGQLEEALADCACGGRGMIHMTRLMATVLAHKGALRREGGLLLTILDTIVVPGVGYPGTGPDDAMSAAGEWMYATGMVKVWRGAVQLFPAGDDEREWMSQALDRSTNTITARAERPYMVGFDPCCHAAAHADPTIGLGS